MIWLILSEKTGDNAQLLALAKALPWPCLIKHVAVKEPFVFGKPRVSASLHHVDPQRSDVLEPPWPDLVITVGRRMSMAALWIKAQSEGRTRLVLIGPPKGLAARFDLVVVSEQYKRMHRSNVMRITYPLQYADVSATPSEIAAFREEFGELPYPLIAVLVGGSTKAVRFDAGVAARLASDITQLAQRERGTLFVTTSRRTPPGIVDVLKRELPAEAILYRWTPDAARNPYRALLRCADRFVVTSDSLSMLMEIARLGRPLSIYPLPASSWLGRWGLPTVHDMAGEPEKRTSFIVSALDKLAQGTAALGRQRDLTAVSQRLVQDGFAVWVGERFLLDARHPPDELARVVARITALLEPHRIGPESLSARAWPYEDRKHSSVS